MAGAPVPTFGDVGWAAPAPFPDLAGASRKVQLDPGRVLDRMDMIMRKLRLSGRPAGSTELKYPGSKLISEALNAYNMRRANREHQAWAWIDDRILKIPHHGVNITGNEKWTPSEAHPGDDNSLYQDLYHQWSPLATWPLRTIPGTPGALKYRLAVFIHKHTPRRASGTVQKIDTVYSVSIWDRERNELRWHDPWPYGDKTERRQNMIRYWRDCRTGWRNNPESNIDFSNILQISNTYNSLAVLQGCSFREMEPRFSYWSVIGIILWCMNNIDNADPAFIMQPPDTPGVLSGMDADLIPALYASLFVTMYENVYIFVWPGVGGPPGVINTFRTLLRAEYRLDFSPYFRREVFRHLGPLRVSQGGPLPNWAVRAMVGRT